MKKGSYTATEFSDDIIDEIKRLGIWNMSQISR